MCYIKVIHFRGKIFSQEEFFANDLFGHFAGIKFREFIFFYDLCVTFFLVFVTSTNRNVINGGWIYLFSLGYRFMGGSTTALFCDQN